MTRGSLALGLACFLALGLAIDSLLTAVLAPGPAPLRWSLLIAAVVLCLLPALLNLTLAMLQPWWRKRRHRGLRVRGERTAVAGIPLVTLLSGAVIAYVGHGDWWSALTVLTAFLLDPYGPVWGLVRRLRTKRTA